MWCRQLAEWLDNIFQAKLLWCLKYNKKKLACQTSYIVQPWRRWFLNAITRPSTKTTYFGASTTIRFGMILGQVKKTYVSRPDFYKKRADGRFFCYLLFLVACFLYTLLPSPRDTLELLGQILTKRNIRYWSNTSLFNFDTHKGLTVKIYIILVN